MIPDLDAFDAAAPEAIRSERILRWPQRLPRPNGTMAKNALLGARSRSRTSASRRRAHHGQLGISWSA